MDWSAAHLLCGIALLLAILSCGGLVWTPPTGDARLAPGLGLVAVMLVAIAGLVR